MKFFYLPLTLLIFCNSFLFSQKLEENPVNKRDDPSLRKEYESKKYLDSNNKQIPYEVFEKTQQEISSKIKSFKKLKPNSAVQGLNWVERGPNNIAGRTQTIMFDPNDIEHKKVWAGAIAGGLWYNNDITSAISSWQKVNDFWDNLAISSIAFDPSNHQIFYVSTGSIITGPYNYNGGGIWKTIDGGLNWERLVNTIPVNFPPDNASPFIRVKKIIVNNSGHLFIATSNGILKSTDGGNTFQTVLAPISCIGLNNNCQTNFSNESFDLEIATDGIIYASFDGGFIFKSTNQNGIEWINISPAVGFRTEIALASSTSGENQVLYAISAYSYFKKSLNGGISWVDVQSVGYDQSWYNLALAVDPSNPNNVMVGLVGLFSSKNGGDSWDYISALHSDQHTIVYRPDYNNEIFVGNDGGIFYIRGVAPNFYIEYRNTNFNITQYYSVAVKNIQNDGYILGGTQDNGTNRINSNLNTISYGSQSLGADGTYCFIDQDEPNIQIASFQGGNFFLLDGNGNYVQYLTTGGNSFLNAADYDDINNILYVNKDNYNQKVILKRVRNVGTLNLTDEIILDNEQNLLDPFIKLGKNGTNLFISTISTFEVGSRLYKISNINNDNTRSITRIDNNYFNFRISNIEIGENDDEIIVTSHEFNKESVWYTNNGGLTWISKDKPDYGLPNMPINWSVFNPKNSNQLFLATDFGVWSTDNIKALNPEWQITSINLARTPCKMLIVRESDNIITVGTYGRGIFQAIMPDGVCTTDYLINEPIYSQENKEYGAVNSVTGINSIGTNSNVTFNGGNFVDLNPGFEAKAGSIFKAVILGCSPNLKQGIFSGDVLISYNLTENSNITLEIFDQNNKKIKTLIRNSKRMAGNHEYLWKIKNIEEGNYIYVLTTKNSRKANNLSIFKTQ